MTPRDLVALVGALAWPVVVVVAILLLRRPLSQFLKEAGSRLSSVSFAQLSVELAVVPRTRLPWEIAGQDVRYAARADVFDTAAHDLFQQLSQPGAADYMVAGLGSGKSWLTTRLYIFAAMLERMRDLRCVVFVAGPAESPNRFVGLASPARIRWSLAKAYPYLEGAFARACAKGYGNNPFEIETDIGGLPADQARELVRAFLMDEQIQMPGPMLEPDWLVLPKLRPTDLDSCEHAEWLTANRVEELLGLTAGTVETQSLLDSLDTPTEERVKAIVRRKGRYVALLDAHGRFTNLVDRESLIERVAESSAQR